MGLLLTIKINIYDSLCCVKASNAFLLFEDRDECIWKGNNRQFRVTISWFKASWVNLAKRGGCVEKMRGLPNDCCMSDWTLCCFEKQRGVPHANSKGILRKRGSKKEDNALCVIQCLLWRTRDSWAGMRGPLMCHCVTVYFIFRT